MFTYKINPWKLTETFKYGIPSGKRRETERNLRIRMKGCREREVYRGGD